MQIIYLATWLPVLTLCHITVHSGDIADLIFVFFDPIGQALCKRTLTLVEKLNDKHAERMRFYLSKADEAGHEADRQVILFRCGFVAFKLSDVFFSVLLYSIMEHTLNTVQCACRVLERGVVQDGSFCNGFKQL